MARISRATAFANNEVAFIAWEIDRASIPGCLGFHIVREYLDANDQVVGEKPLASYVAFKGQRNPDWLPQNTSVWPVQKFTWRDLTLRKRRDKATRRRMDDRVRYRIRAVGRLKDGMEPVVTVQERHKDAKTGKLVDNTYTGKPIALGYLTPAKRTNIVDVTSKRPPFFSTFTNGILSTQFLLNVLEEDGKIEPGELEKHLKKPNDWLRNYLSGDVLPTVTDFFAQPKGRFHAALYELEDEQLEALLARHASRLDLILSDAGTGTGDDDDDDGTNATTYDTRNAPARKKLRALAKKKGTTFTMQDRLFNGSGHIGHNKFVVYVNAAGVAKSVLTGSTNWTWSGVGGQSNNCIRIDNDAVAAAYLAYWQRLQADPQPTPKDTSAKNPGAGQGDPLKTSDRDGVVVETGRERIEVWFSPNMPGKKQPPSASVKTPPPPPPDMDRLFSLMRQAKRSIFFLVFMPSRGGVNSIVSEAVALGQKDSSLDVVGAISDTQAMWGYKPGSKDDTGKKVPASSPHIYEQGGVSVVRATALTDKEIGKPLGDFSFDEKLTVGRAIIHDKILVLDPTDPEHCSVAFGSHNLGYKASYSNDENLVIVRGNRPLALAYAAHVLDVFDHYRFRAAEAEVSQKKSASSTPQFDGFLDASDAWQKHSSHRLSKYFSAATKL